MKKATLIIIMALFLIPPPLGAETIYTWKDRNGVETFSNAPPPEDVTEYKTTETSPAETIYPTSDEQRRSSFDQMVKEASQAAKSSSDNRKKKAAAKAAEQNRIIEEKQQAKRQAERKKLESQIEAIKKRAVSRTYPNGMKQAQINALLKEIEKLEQPSGSAKEQ